MSLLHKYDNWEDLVFLSSFIINWLNTSQVLLNVEPETPQSFLLNFFLLSRDPSVVGSLDFWFKLHTAAASRIQEWLDHRQEVQRALEIANKENEARTTLAEVQLLKG